MSTPRWSAPPSPQPGIVQAVTARALLVVIPAARRLGAFRRPVRYSVAIHLAMSVVTHVGADPGDGTTVDVGALPGVVEHRARLRLHDAARRVAVTRARQRPTTDRPG